MDRINPAKTTELLNELAKGAACYYLSDLHAGENVRAVSAAIDAIQPGRFPLEDWREAARYILQSEEVQGENVPGVVAFLKAGLHGNE